MDSGWTPENGLGRSEFCKYMSYLVGLAGFEPTTSCTPSKRAGHACKESARTAHRE